MSVGDNYRFVNGFNPSAGSITANILKIRAIRDEWMRRKSSEFASRPEYKSTGAYLKGPCPLCSGHDRFFVYANSGRFGCQQGCSHADIAKAAGFDPKNHAGDWQPETAAVEYKDNADRAPSKFKVLRTDNLDGSKTIKQTAGAKLKPGRKWLTYAPGGLRESRPKLIVQGERCAQDAAAILQNWDVRTWARGVADTDWSFVKDAAVWLWVDNDRQGLATLPKLQAEIKKAGATVIKCVRPPAPEKWDCSDAVIADRDLQEIINLHSYEWSSNAAKPLFTDTVDGMIKAFDYQQITIKYNAPACRIELHKPESSECGLFDGEKAVLSDNLEAAFRLGVEAGFVIRHEGRKDRPSDPTLRTAKIPDSRWNLVMKATCNHARYFPLMEYLQSLPEWDGIDRTRSMFSQFWQIEAEPGLIEFASRYPFALPVWRAFKPGHPCKTMPILKGPQNAGKSLMVKLVLPENLREDLLNEGLDLKDTPEKWSEGIRGKTHTELSEMAGLRKAEAETLKSWASRQSDVARLKYHQHVSTIPRSTCIIGTTNDDRAIPYDPSGSSRFLVLDINPKTGKSLIETTGEMVRYIDENRSQLWAEELHYYHQGVEPDLPHDMRIAQERQNISYQNIDTDHEDFVLTLQERALERGFADGYTISGLRTLAKSQNFDLNEPGEDASERRIGNYRFAQILKSVAGGSMIQAKNRKTCVLTGDKGRVYLRPPVTRVQSDRTSGTVKVSSQGWDKNIIEGKSVVGPDSGHRSQSAGDQSTAGVSDKVQEKIRQAIEEYEDDNRKFWD